MGWVYTQPKTYLMNTVTLNYFKRRSDMKDVEQQTKIGILSKISKKAVCVDGDWFTISSLSKFNNEEKLELTDKLEPYIGQKVKITYTSRWVDDITILDNKQIQSENKKQQAQIPFKSNNDVLDDIEVQIDEETMLIDLKIELINALVQNPETCKLLDIKNTQTLIQTVDELLIYIFQQH